MDEAFASYAHVDETATYGRVARIIGDTQNTYHSLTGCTLVVFVDSNSIQPGQQWRNRIAAGLASSALLLAFVSPAYLRSENCRSELSSFLTTQHDTHVIPLLFADRARILRDFSGDPTWRELEKIQFIDISQLRRAEPGSRVWLERIELIAARIDEVLNGATV